jgi:hypothetical protein
MKDNGIKNTNKPEKAWEIYPQEVDSLLWSADDVFLNRLDLTWMKSENPPNNDYSRTISKLPVEYFRGDDNKEITYSYNSSGFRSDEFINDHNGKHHILFAGCSETEGYGANIGEFWPSMVYESFKKETTSGFFNLARGGWGWEKIIANSMIYFEKYGAPEYMFIMLPNIYRYSQYFEENGGWHQIQRYLDDHENPVHAKNPAVMSYIKENHVSRDNYLTEFIRFISGWKLYLKHCKAIGIKVVWSSWNSLDARNISNMYEFDGFVKLGLDSELRQVTSKIAAEKKINGSLKSNDVRRRDGHNGTILHQLWADKFLEAIQLRGLDLELF